MQSPQQRLHLMTIRPELLNRLALLREILVAVRLRNHLTTAQLAERLDMREAFVLDSESRKYCLDLPELVDVADALGIDMIELVNLYQQMI